MKKFNMVILLASLLFNACGSESYLSKNPNNKMIIDGKLFDWAGDLKYIEDEKSAVGVKNDNDYLYVSFTTSDRTKIMQIFGMGFTVWIKPVNSKTLGIQFPLKTDNMPKFNFSMRSGTKKNINRMIKNYLKKNNEFLILNDDNFPLYGAKLNKNTGYKIGLGYQSGKFVYELKIPFSRHNDKHIPIIKIPDKKFEIEFETGETESNLSTNSKIPSGNSGIGLGGGRVGRRGPARSTFGSQRIPEKIEISLDVQLQ